MMKIYDILDDVRYIRYGEQYKSQDAPFSVQDTPSQKLSPSSRHFSAELCFISRAAPLLPFLKETCPKGPRAETKAAAAAAKAS